MCDGMEINAFSKSAEAMENTNTFVDRPNSLPLCIKAKIYPFPIRRQILVINSNTTSTFAEVFFDSP